MAEHPFPVVGVGASAGGLAPLTQLIATLPPRPGLALVVVQHLDPHHESRLTSLLEPHTSMTVLEAVHGAKVEPDHIYVIQPNTNVAIADGVLSVTMRPDGRRPHYPVDHFLRSLASVQGPYAVGVILSGTGSDGTLGVCEVKAAGGLTFAQDAVGPASRDAGERDRQRRRRPDPAAAGDRRAAVGPGPASLRRQRTRGRGAGGGRRASSSGSSPRCAARRAWTSASTATPQSSGGPPGGCCSAGSSRPTTTRASSNVTARRPKRSTATSSSTSPASSATPTCSTR